MAQANLLNVALKSSSPVEAFETDAPITARARPKHGNDVRLRIEALGLASLDWHSTSQPASPQSQSECLCETLGTLHQERVFVEGGPAW
jgi:hypothetical protein